MEAILSVMLIQSPTAAGLIGKTQLEDVQIACDLGLTHAEGGAQILAQSRRSVEGDGAVGTLVKADSEDHGGEPVNVISVKMGDEETLQFVASKMDVCGPVEYLLLLQSVEDAHLPKCSYSITSSTNALPSPQSKSQFSVPFTVGTIIPRALASRYHSHQPPTASPKSGLHRACSQKRHDQVSASHFERLSKRESKPSSGDVVPIQVKGNGNKQWKYRIQFNN